MLITRGRSNIFLSAVQSIGGSLEAKLLKRQIYFQSKGNNSSFSIFSNSVLFTLVINNKKIKIINSKIAHFSFTQKM